LIFLRREVCQLNLTREPDRSREQVGPPQRGLRTGNGV